jgi:hypothetical protein
MPLCLHSQCSLLLVRIGVAQSPYCAANGAKAGFLNSFASTIVLMARIAPVKEVSFRYSGPICLGVLQRNERPFWSPGSMRHTRDAGLLCVGSESLTMVIRIIRGVRWSEFELLSEQGPARRRMSRGVDSCPRAPREREHRRALRRQTFNEDARPGLSRARQGSLICPKAAGNGPENLLKTPNHRQAGVMIPSNG